MVIPGDEEQYKLDIKYIREHYDINYTNIISLMCAFMNIFITKEGEDSFIDVKPIGGEKSCILNCAVSSKDLAQFIMVLDSELGKAIREKRVPSIVKLSRIEDYI